MEWADAPHWRTTATLSQGQSRTHQEILHNKDNKRIFCQAYLQRAGPQKHGGAQKRQNQADLQGEGQEAEAESGSRAQLPIEWCEIQ